MSSMPADPGSAATGLALRQDGAAEASLWQGGRFLLQLRAAEGAEGEFAGLLARLDQALCRPRPPRVVVTYQEGLLGPVHAEQPLDLLFVEDDPHDLPPVQLRRLRVAGEPEAVETAIALAERRAGQAAGR